MVGASGFRGPDACGQQGRRGRRSWEDISAGARRGLAWPPPTPDGSPLGLRGPIPKTPPPPSPAKTAPGLESAHRVSHAPSLPCPHQFPVYPFLNLPHGPLPGPGPSCLCLLFPKLGSSSPRPSSCSGILS